MANVDAPLGFIPAGHLTGGEIRSRKYTLTTAAIVYPGDVLKVVAGGTVERAAAGDGLICVGVAAEYKDGTTAGTQVLVYDDPNIIFKVQAQTGDTPAATEEFSTGDHLATAGNATLLQSREELKIDGNAQFKIIGLSEEPNNAWGEHADVLVIFNEHLYKAAVAGV